MNGQVFKKNRCCGWEIENPSEGEMPALSEEKDAMKKKKTVTVNLNFLWVGLVVCLAFLLMRIFYLQGLKGHYYQLKSEHNRVKAIIIKAPRGIIKDCHGKILAQNIPSFDAVFIPAELPTEEASRKALYQQVSRLLGLKEEEIVRIIKKTPFRSTQPYLLKEGISHNEALKMVKKVRELPGIFLEKSAVREYLDGPIFSSIIGYDGKITEEELKEHPDYLMTDYIGKNGLEYSYEKWLRGKHGQHRVEVDSTGNIKEDMGIISPVPGSDLILNIDAELQEKAYQVLEKIITDNSEATGAALVAINPQNGGVLALVSVPGFDNNKFAKGINPEDYQHLLADERKPLLNRALTGEYPPGSTFKPFVAAAALEENVINERTTVNCRGSMSVGKWVFPDWKAHGITDVKKAIAESCDVFFYSVGGGGNGINNALGINRLSRYGRMFGFGEPTGIDLPWEGKGLMPNQEWKFKKFGEKWYIGDDYHCAIGQGYVTVTLVQLANATAAIANGGKVFQPQIVDAILSSDGKKKDIMPKIIRENFISPDNLKIVREGMRETIASAHGSGRRLSDLKVAVAGKTGTAQFGTEEKTHSWFISFAPYDKPEIAMAVLIEGGGEGHEWAVPATKEILKWYFEERPNQQKESNQ